MAAMAAMPDNHGDDMAATPPPADAGVTAAEAAVLLGISERTVLRRLKQGTLQGYKVDAGRGTMWRVMLDGMAATPTPSPDTVAATPPASDVTPPALAEFAHAVIDELRQEYRHEIDRLQRDNQQLAGQVGFLQAKLQSAEEQIRLLSAPKDEPQPARAPEPEPVQRAPWWRKLFR